MFENISEKIAAVGAVPVIKLNYPERDALPLAKALCEGGIPIAEVTFRAAGADKAIKIMSDAFP
ncbi:MAG: 2-dehydro-3-deoxyphosphogluconate aldolase, partial [Firmicutes bacterium]|nr:2-dehydro-3-deoxyphosphogluconate aldolase [Candidatus Colimorpha enterica]